MFRLPQNRKSRMQLALVLCFLVAFAVGVKTLADYFDWVAESVDLRDAISRGDLDLVKQFEREGVDWRDLNDLDGNYAPLFAAISQNHLNLVRYFVENGADITAARQDGFTPATWAAHYGWVEILKYLLMERPEGESLARTEPFIRPLGDFADLELVAWLSTRRDLNDLIFGEGALRLLCVAVHEEDLDMVDYLLEVGAPDGLTAENWDEGFSRKEQSAAANAARWLALYDNPNLPSPLHQAALVGNEAIVKRLLEHGANPDAKESNGLTPIDYARLEGHESIAKLLEAARDGR